MGTRRLQLVTRSRSSVSSCWGFLEHSAAISPIITGLECKTAKRPPRDRRHLGWWAVNKRFADRFLSDGTAAAARVGAGALAGAAATLAMDAVTEVLYTEHIKNVEQKIASRGAAAAVAYKLMDALGLEPNDADAERGGRILHWGLGIGAGMLAGLASDRRVVTPVVASAATAAGMLCFDEFGLSAIGATPPSSQYPWQTNVRSVLGHLFYGVVLAAGFSLLTRFWRDK